MFMGGLLLLAAVITWGISFLMSPHGDSVAEGTEHVRTVVALFMRNSAIGTLILCALAGWLLFPARRPKWPQRDYAIIALIALLALTSLYDLIWLQTSVLS
jgi:drug/metabolite transporter (DMT)-like permease